MQNESSREFARARAPFQDILTRNWNFDKKRKKGSSYEKKIIAVIAGIVAGVITVGVLEFIGHQIYPLPDGINPKNPDDQKILMSVMPVGAKIAVLVAYFFGSLVAAAVALKMSDGDKKSGWMPVGLLWLFGMMTMLMFPHPVWMIVAAALIPLVAGWLAQRWLASA